jgi:acetylornithine/N-succinyldiaminopimelate aminotransferase
MRNSINDVFMNTYHKLPVVFSRGEGARLYDTEERSYLDFTSGIAVNSLGHAHPRVVEALSAQAARLLHVCNYYDSEVTTRFAQTLVRLSGMKKVFLCNSGAEANEGAIKIARKYSLKKYGPGRHKIVTLTGGFHGRTITTVSATGQPKFHENFGPFTEGFQFVPPNDKDALEAALDSKTAALFIEPIQGESGVIPMNSDYIKFAAGICADKDILFMADEIQCGSGRTGSFFALSNYGVKADVATLAKGLAAGIPVGAVLASEKTADVLQPGDHGSTFGGNVLAAAAGIVFLETISAPGFMREIEALGAYFMEALKEAAGGEAANIRGRGLMIGCDTGCEARGVLEACAAAASKEKPGLLALQAGKNTLRFLPPYVISRADIDSGLSILGGVLKSARP